VGLFESNVSGLNKPGIEKAKIDAHLEHQHRLARQKPVLPMVLQPLSPLLSLS
jgi:hypothetical protein